MNPNGRIVTHVSQQSKLSQVVLKVPKIPIEATAVGQQHRNFTHRLSMAMPSFLKIPPTLS